MFYGHRSVLKHIYIDCTEGNAAASIPKWPSKKDSIVVSTQEGQTFTFLTCPKIQGIAIKIEEPALQY